MSKDMAFWLSSVPAAIGGVVVVLVLLRGITMVVETPSPYRAIFAGVGLYLLACGILAGSVWVCDLVYGVLGGT